MPYDTEGTYGIGDCTIRAGETHVDWRTKIAALDARSGAALTVGEPDRPTESLVTKWEDLS